MTARDDDAPELTVVVACYMEQGHLRDSVAQLTATLDELGRSYELLFVEDASRDDTAAIVRELTDGHPHRRAIYHERNVGRGGTVTEGMLAARGRVVGFLDIDLEVHCSYLPAVLAAIDAGADGATAYRNYDVGLRPAAIVRHVLSQGYRWLFRTLFDVPFRDPETGFKFFRRDRVLPVLLQTRDTGWFWDSEVMILSHQHGLTITEVPTRFVRRADKQSTVRICRDVIAYLVAITRFRRRQRTAQRAADTQTS